MKPAIKGALGFRVRRQKGHLSSLFFFQGMDSGDRSEEPAGQENQRITISLEYVFYYSEMYY